MTMPTPTSPPKFTLTAADLSSAQACPRKYLLSLDWRVVRWRPKSLFDACLRRAILSLSSGADLSATIADARTAFLTSAANPGLDLLGDTWTAAKDWTALLASVLTGVARRLPPPLHDLPAARLSASADWRFLSHADDRGVLHRWVTVDAWGESDLSRELHSWLTIADMVLAQSSLAIHVVVIGRLASGGRRASPWTRAYRHPGMPNLRLRFRKKGGGDLTGWDSVYLADLPGLDDDRVSDWVDQLYAEGAGDDLLRMVNVSLPDAPVCDDIRRQVQVEAIRLRQLSEERGSSPATSLPMHRAACDSFGPPCAFQPVCYVKSPVDPATLGLYQSRNRVSIPSEVI